jgi:hypothetical protein
VKAKATGKDLAYTITKGYVVVSDDQASVDEAVRLSGEASLRENRTYRTDTGRLSGDQVAVGWADLQQVYQAAKAALPIDLPSNVTDQLKGRVVTGLHLTGDYAELEGLALDVPQQTAPKVADATLIRGLPASTAAAVSWSGLGDTLKAQLDGLAGSGIDPEAIAGELLGDSGLTLAGDVLPLFGEQSVLALGAFPEGLEGLRAALVSKPKNVAKAKQAGDVLALLSSAFGLPAEASVKDDTFYLATGGYGAELRAGSGLGSSAKFTKATGDLAGASNIAYVDLAAYRAAQDEPDPRLAGLTSAGMVNGVRDGNQFFRLRIVAG